MANGGFALIVVLFILLIIIGPPSWVGVLIKGIRNKSTLKGGGIYGMLWWLRWWLWLLLLPVFATVEEWVAVLL